MLISHHYGDPRGQWICSDGPIIVVGIDAVFRYDFWLKYEHDYVFSHKDFFRFLFFMKCILVYECAHLLF